MRSQNMIQRIFRKQGDVRRVDGAGRRCRIRLEHLEDRTTPVTNSWNGGSGLWSDDASWSLGHDPISTEDVDISNGATVTHNGGADTVLSLSISGNSTLILSGGSITDTTTLSAPAATADFRLAGGTLASATLLAGSEITVTGSSGYLSGVTIAGTLDLSSIYGGWAYIIDGLTLNNGTIKIGSVGASPTYGYLYFYNDGSQTLGGTGTVNFGDSTNSIFYFYGPNVSDTLTIEPGITIQGANGTINSNSNSRFDFQGTITSDPTTVGSALTSGLITISGGNWVNQGTIQARHGGSLTLGGNSTSAAPAWTNALGRTISIQDNGTLNLNGGGTPAGSTNATWHNFGTISATVVPTGVPATNLIPTVNLGGIFNTTALGTFNHPTNSDGRSAPINITGTMYNVGSTFTFNATTGSWYLRGGTVQGGTIKAESGVALIATNSGGYMGGVTLDGTGGNASPVDFSTVNGAFTYLYGGLTLNSATINLGTVGASPTYGYLYFYNAGPQTFGGTGTVNFGDSTNNIIYFYSSYTSDTLTVESGITIQGANGTINSNSGSRFDFQGTITSDPTTVLSALTSGLITISGNDWVNEGTIQAKHGGSLTLGGTSTWTAPAWTNALGHTISIQDNGTLNLNGSGTPALGTNATWRNFGAIGATVVPTGVPATNLIPTVNLGGIFNTTALGAFNHPTNSDGRSAPINVTGTMYNAGSTFTFTASTGSWFLRGGAVQGGTIKAESGVALIGTGSGGYLNGVTLDGTGGNASPLDLSTINATYTYVTGGLTLNSATINLGTVGASPTYGYLYFYNAGDQTFGGTGTVNFGDSASNIIYFYSGYPSHTLTVEPGITIQGANGQINSNSNSSFDFQGTITSDPTTVGSALTNTTVTITTGGAGSWLNEGTFQARNTGRILAQGPNANFAAGTLTGGTWKVFNNSILRLVNTGITTNAATIVLDGANANFYRDGGTTNALTNFAANAAAGNFTILNGRNLTTAGAFANAGNVTVGAGSTFTLPGVNNYTQTGGTTTLNGTLTTGGAVDIQGGTLTGGGTIAANFISTGPVVPGASPGTLTVNGSFTQAATSVLNIEIGGAAPGTAYDQVVVSGDVTLDGTLNVTRFGGFVPQDGDVYRILDKTGAGAIVGDLGLVEGATFIADGFTFAISYVGGNGNDVTLTAINIPPTLAAIPDPPAILEDAVEQTINLTGISAGGGQTQTLTVTAISNNPGLIPNPTVTYTSPNSTGSLHYTPVPNQNGSAVITVTVDDGAGGTHTIQQTFTVQVTGVNDAPSFTKGLDQQVLEDAGAQNVSGWASSIIAGPANENGQSLTFLVSTDNDALFSVLPAITSGGNLTYTPATNMNGSATVTVSLMDNGGTASGGDNTSDSQTFTITLTAVNDAPSFTKGPDQFVPEGAGAQNVPGWATNLSAGPANENGQTLSFLLNTDNDPLFAILPAIDSSGNLTYTPAANANGSATVTVQLKDTGGTANGGVDSSTQTFLVTLTPANDRPALDPLDTRMLPVIAVRSAILPVGGLITDLTKNVTDPDPGSLKGVAITQVDTAKGVWQYDLLGNPTGWTDISGVSDTNALLLADDGNTLIRFVPNAGFTGFASLRFRAWDRTNVAAEGTFDDPTNVNDTSYSLLDDRAWIAVGNTNPTVDPDGRTVLKAILPVYTAASKVVPLAPVLVKDMLGIAGQEAGLTATLGAAIISADTNGGNWQYQLAGTKNWVDVGAVSATSALLLRPTDKLCYLPTTAADGPAELKFKTWESVGPTGPTYGTATGTAVLDLIPILDLSVAATLNPVDAGQTTAGAAFSTMMSARRIVGTNVGVAIVATKGTGTWEYRPVGGDWTPVGKVSAGTALFLNPADEIRFRADATALPHTASLSFKAWDKTKFAAGARGGATGSIVSKETEILTVAVGNTAPTLTPGGGITVPPVSSSATKPSAGTQIGKLLAGVTITDTPKSLKGIAIVGADNSNGKWQYSVAPNVWIDLGDPSVTSAVLLADTSKIRFLPNAAFTGTATFTFKAWDRTAGQAGDRIDTTGMLNSFSTDVEVATITVTT